MRVKTAEVLKPSPHSTGQPQKPTNAFTRALAFQCYECVCWCVNTPVYIHTNISKKKFDTCIKCIALTQSAYNIIRWHFGESSRVTPLPRPDGLERVHCSLSPLASAVQRLTELSSKREGVRPIAVCICADTG